MKSRHCFVSSLDVGEQLPFTPKDSNNLHERLRAQKEANEALNEFIELLQKHFKEKIYHVGAHSVHEKSYHRFMFEGAGFLEVMVEAPVAINAHFNTKKRASKFLRALKETIRVTLPDSRKRELFLRTIDIEDEHRIPLTLQSWSRIKDIRSVLQRSVTIAVLSIFLFVVIEFGKAFFTEVFSKVFGIHEVFVIIVLAILIAFLFRPIERFVDNVMSRFIFKK